MNRTQVSKVWLSESAIWIELTDGRKANEKFADYTRLASASIAERENFRLSHFGIHWPEIDEDLSFDGFFNKLDKHIESSEKVR